jgi:hypothetical protein
MCAVRKRSECGNFVRILGAAKRQPGLFAPHGRGQSIAVGGERYVPRVSVSLNPVIPHGMPDGGWVRHTDCLSNKSLQVSGFPR